MDARKIVQNPISVFAFLGFFCLYPIFFWYHLGIAFGLVPTSIVEILRGLYGPVAAIIFAVSVLYFFQIFRTYGTSKAWISRIYLLYVLWATVVLVANLAFNQKAYTEDAAIKLFEDLILQTANFFVGVFLFVRTEQKSNWLILASWVGMVFVTLALFDPNFSSLHARLAYDEDIVTRREVSVSFSNYQGFARSFLFTALFSLAVVTHIPSRVLIVICSALVLAWIGARSEFLAFVFAVTAFEICLAIRNKNHFLRLRLTLVVLAILVLILSALILHDFTNLRSMNFLSLSLDGSWLARMDQLKNALVIVKFDPLFGDFAAHLKDGDHGDIPHNILAAQTMLGLPGFIILNVLIFGSLFESIRMTFSSQNTNAAWSFSLLLALMALPQVMLVKSAFVEWLPLIFGSVVASTLSSEQLET